MILHGLRQIAPYSNNSLAQSPSKLIRSHAGDWTGGRHLSYSRIRLPKRGSSHYPVCRETSNNIIQKGLAFVREQSGSVTVPGTKRASGSCPAGCMAEVGLRWWRRTTPHQRNGGSRCQHSPIPNSSFCPRLRGAMIAELTCRQTLRAKRFERPWISSSALGGCKRS